MVHTAVYLRMISMWLEASYVCIKPAHSPLTDVSKVGTVTVSAQILL